MWTSVFEPQQYFSLGGSSLKVCVCVYVHVCAQEPKCDPSGKLFSPFLRTEQSRQDIPLSQSLIHGKAPILLNSVKAERGEQAAEEKFEVAGFNHEV